MRVIAGCYRGRELAAPRGTKTRPTGSKVREAVFDILGERVAGATFLDLYAGSGAMGIEALSRGAERAIFVEAAGPALKCLRENLEGLNPRPAFRILADRAEKALRRLSEEMFAADIIFADPPYADQEWDALLGVIGGSGLLAEGGCLVVEHSAKKPQPAPGGLVARKTYRYGDTALTLFIRTGSTSVAGTP